MAESELRYDGPADAQWTVILAHGAGQGMGSEFMEYFAKGLAAQEIRTLRYEFPYMRQTGLDGKRRPPNSEPVLREAWQEASRRYDLRSGQQRGQKLITAVFSAVIAFMVTFGPPSTTPLITSSMVMPAFFMHMGQMITCAPLSIADLSKP